jgi:two-component system sensor kinase FixL
MTRADKLPKPASPPPVPERSYEQQLREMNAALLLSLVHQQELAEKAMAAEHQSNQDERVRQRQLSLTNALRVSTVGELATGLAHELNQPLASISNLLAACTHHVRAGSADRAKLLKLLADAAGEAMRAAEIISHLRSFVSKGEPQLARMDLREVVSSIPHLLIRDLELARTELKVEISPDPLPVDVDRTQIEQVLVNLIRNALDAIEEGDQAPRRIELRTRGVGRMAEVSVRDTGVGVGPDDAERFFRPFFTTKTLGLGMGLALSRSILEGHQGRIWMEAPDDGGPGVTVRFAIELQAAQRGRKLDRSKQSGAGARAPRVRKLR